ncbi:MAG TPA: LysM domain-containing protein [Desulfobacteria bacterium]|nr:LysM domain-containing protein [Desulfobacteria bacterium]
MSGFELIYKVQQGDTIVSIAKKFGVELAELIKNNPQLKNLASLVIGEEIYIPVKK